MPWSPQRQSEIIHFHTNSKTKTIFLVSETLGDELFIFIYNAKVIINNLYSGNPLMSTFANSEDQDEMQHNAAFHQGLHCLKVKKIFRQRIQYFFKNYNLTPLDRYNGLSQVY